MEVAGCARVRQKNRGTLEFSEQSKGGEEEREKGGGRSVRKRMLREYWNRSDVVFLGCMLETKEHATSPIEKGGRSGVVDGGGRLRQEKGFGR